MAQHFYDLTWALTVGAILLLENHGGKEPKPRDVQKSSIFYRLLIVFSACKHKFLYLVIQHYLMKMVGIFVVFYGILTVKVYSHTER